MKTFRANAAAGARRAAVVPRAEVRYLCVSLLDPVGWGAVFGNTVAVRVSPRDQVPSQQKVQSYA